MNREYIYILHIYIYKIYIYNICVYIQYISIYNIIYIWMSLDVPSSFIFHSSLHSEVHWGPASASGGSSEHSRSGWISALRILRRLGSDVLTRREAKRGPKQCPPRMTMGFLDNFPFPHIQQPPRNPGFRKGFTHIWDHIWVFKYLEYSGDHPRKQPDLHCLQATRRRKVRRRAKPWFWTT